MKKVKFTVEVIEPRIRPKGWGDIDPATGQVTGTYGKAIGIQEHESEITEENGYTNIITLPPGMSPEGYIDMRIKEINKENGCE
tara:strand:+ start:153673 stop:153924 length:252 start_codon:yes stop_codon:yes gene_type:complete